MDSTVGLDAAASSSSETLVESLLVELLALPVDEREGALAASCRLHPRLAPTLLRRMALLCDLLPPLDGNQGTQRFHRFALQRRLDGGTAEVYVATDLANGAEVLLKLLRHPALLDPAARRSLEREAFAAARLDHPGIGKVLEIGEFEGVPYLVQAFVEGISLAEWLDRHRRGGVLRERGGLALTDIDLVLGWLEGIARALHVAHQHGLVHRDVKPSNILLPFRGRPLLLDFGMCQEIAPSSGSARTPTPVGGTLAYMAPELLAPRERPVGPAADIHALGVTLFEAVTLRLPYSGADEQQLSRAILLQAPPTRRQCPRHPRGVHRVIACAMAKAAWERYPSAEAFADDLARLRRGEPVAPPCPPWTTRWARWCGARRHLLWASLLLVMPLLVLVFAEHSLAEAKDPDLELMAISSRLAVANAHADELVPGRPDQVPAMRRWLTEEGEPLGATLPALQSRLAELRRSALPDPAVLAVLVAVEVQLVQFVTGARGALPRMRERLAWALGAEELTLRAPAQAWRDTIEAVAADPRYRGLRLRPMLELVPLGPDPQSGLFEFYHPRSAWTGSLPVHRDPKSKKLVLHDTCGLVFVLIPPGTCRIGEQHEDPLRPRYDPTAAVYSEPFEFAFDAFLLSKYEMTQVQWLHLAGENPSTFRIGRSYYGDIEVGYRHPVESVSAADCDELLREFGLVLPTDAQWEYACGARADTLWFFGDEPDGLSVFGNIDDQAHAHLLGLRGGAPGDDGMTTPAPVGRYLANPFGLHDVYGNVAEWCRDTCADHTASAPMPKDGFRMPPEPSGIRAFRGGHYGQHVPTSRRLGAAPDLRSQSLGLRPAMALAEASR